MCRYVVLMVVELVGSGAEPAVKPKIPLAGRPETFIGAIGTFTARADAHPKTIQLGDTVEYRVDVLGKGDVSAVTVPHLYRQRGFAEDFEPVGRPRFESLPDGKRIVYRLRPKTMLSRRIPSLWLTYYDPTLRRFQTIRTEPIALLVQPPHVLGPAQVHVLPLQVGDWEQRPGNQRSMVTILLAVLVVGVFVGLPILVAARRRTGRAGVSPPGSRAVVLAQPKSADDTELPDGSAREPRHPEDEQVQRAIATVAELLDLPVGARTPPEIAQALSRCRVASDLIDELIARWRMVEAYRFGAPTRSVDASQLLKELQTQAQIVASSLTEQHPRPRR